MLWLPNHGMEMWLPNHSMEMFNHYLNDSIQMIAHCTIMSVIHQLPIAPLCRQYINHLSITCILTGLGPGGCQQWIERGQRHLASGLEVQHMPRVRALYCRPSRRHLSLVPGCMGGEKYLSMVPGCMGWWGGNLAPSGQRLCFMVHGAYIRIHNIP